MVDNSREPVLGLTHVNRVVVGQKISGGANGTVERDAGNLRHRASPHRNAAGIIVNAAQAGGIALGAIDLGCVSRKRRQLENGRHIGSLYVFERSRGQ